MTKTANSGAARSSGFSAVDTAPSSVVPSRTGRPATPPAGIAAVGVSQIVTFRLGDELFAADVRSVERVLRHQVPTPVPNVPDWIRGVIEYQKRVVPVLDLRARFELPSQAATATTRVLVFNAQEQWIGAIVDAVLDVTALERAKLEPPPTLFRGLSAEYLKGIVRRDKKLVILLDVDRFLTATERVVLQRASETVSGEPPSGSATAPGHG